MLSFCFFNSDQDKNTIFQAGRGNAHTCYRTKNRSLVAHTVNNTLHQSIGYYSNLQQCSITILLVSENSVTYSTTR